MSPSAAHAADPAFVTHDGRFAAVLGDDPRLIRVVETHAHEGPVYAADEDALYFTTLPRRSGRSAGYPTVAIRRLALAGDDFELGPDRLSTVCTRASAANGMAPDRDGRLVICEQGTLSRPAAISRLDPATGVLERLADDYGGLPLNSPNDVVVSSDGTIWFTDPSYGHLQGFRPAPRVGDHVYRLDPRSGRLTVVADDFVKPNGLAFSPDERVLYITDSGANQEAGSFHAGLPHHIRAFDISAEGHLSGGRLFAVTTDGFPDGIKVDAEGRVYASSAGGVQVFAPSGDLLGEITLPGAVNFAFGGPRRDALLITTDTAVWAAVLAATGPPLPAAHHPEPTPKEA
jgi:gluconolactonase